MSYGTSAAVVVPDGAPPHSGAGRADGLRAEALLCAGVAAASATAVAFFGPPGADLAAHQNTPPVS